MNNKIDFAVKQQNGIRMAIKMLSIDKPIIGKVYDPEITCRILISHRKGYDCSMSIWCGGENKLHIVSIDNHPYYSGITVRFHLPPDMIAKYFIFSKRTICAELMSLVDIKSLYKAMRMHTMEFLF